MAEQIRKIPRNKKNRIKKQVENATNCKNLSRLVVTIIFLTLTRHRTPHSATLRLWITALGLLLLLFFAHKFWYRMFFFSISWNKTVESRDALECSDEKMCEWNECWVHGRLFFLPSIKMQVLDVYYQCRTSDDFNPEFELIDPKCDSKVRSEERLQNFHPGNRCKLDAENRTQKKRKSIRLHQGISSIFLLLSWVC